MSKKSWVAGCLNGVVINNVTRYVGLFGAMGVDDTEVYAKLKSAAGTYSKLNIFVGTNAASTATITFRVNGADGAQTISIGSGQTGWFSDTTHSDTVSEGDVVDIKIVTTGSITFQGNVSAIFTHATAVVHYLGQLNVGHGSGLFATDTYAPLGGANSNDNTEANVKLTQRAAGSYSNLGVIAHNSTPTIRFRKNTANGNQVKAGGSDATWNYDITNSDTVASGDLIDVFLHAQDGTDRWDGTQIRFTSSDGTQDIHGRQNNGVGSGATSYFLPFGLGDGSSSTTETDREAKVPVDGTITLLRANVTGVGSGGSARTITLRVNGADTALTLSFSATGFVEDSTHSVSVVAGDLISIKMVNNAGSGQLVAIPSFLFNPTNSNTETGTGALAFTGIAISGQANDDTGRGTLGFTGFSFSGAATDTRHGAATLTFAGLALLGSGSDTHGTGRMAFSGLAFAGTGVSEHTGTGVLHFGGLRLTAGVGTTGNISSLGRTVKPPGIKLGIQTPIPQGYVLGRTSKGTGDVELLKIGDLQQLGVAGASDALKPAISAKKWATARNLTLGGKAAGAASMDGSADVSLTVTKIATGVLTVATLPGSPTAGQREMVSDATVTTFASVVAGSGANTVPVYYDGAAWRIG